MLAPSCLILGIWFDPGELRSVPTHAKRHDAEAFQRLRTVPGIGKILALTILYEVHDITRFDRCRNLRPTRAS